MTELKVGDKVRVLSGGTGTITYGPVNSTFDRYKMFVVKQVGDEERAFKSIDLEMLPPFAIGDTVTAPGRSGKLVGGPFMSSVSGATFWVLERETGDHLTQFESTLTKVEDETIKVGDRVRVVEDDSRMRAGEFVGKTGVVDRLNYLNPRLPFNVRFDDGRAPRGTWNVAKVVKVADQLPNLHISEGVTYDLDATYSDTDGDVWNFADIRGTVRGSMYGIPPHGDSHTLEYAARTYGPLTKAS